MKKCLIILADIMGAAFLLLGVWIVNYKLPQQGIKTNLSAYQVAQMSKNRVTVSQTSGVQAEGTQIMEAVQAYTDGSSTVSGDSSVGSTDNLVMTDIVLDSQDWHQKFADKFTDKVVATDTTYTSADLSITLTYGSYDTGKTDTSEFGKHISYGTRTSYVVADIYVGDITCFQTAFAQDTYGVGYTEMLTDMSSRMQAVLAINGDSYSNNRHQDNGTIIRNGVIYRNKPSDAETCVLNWDGTMDIYAPGQIDSQILMKKGAYQSWVFGPSLLDENGKARDSFITWNYIRESHPRTAIGYYEPGHYCMVVVDGRQATTRGMFLNEMAKLFGNLGCKAAYNLDGGHCSFMTFQGTVANNPYKPEHKISDGIFIGNMIGGAR